MRPIAEEILAAAIGLEREHAMKASCRPLDLPRAPRMPMRTRAAHALVRASLWLDPTVSRDVVSATALTR